MVAIANQLQSILDQILSIRGISEHELARELGTSYYALRSWRDGNKIPSPETLDYISTLHSSLISKSDPAEPDHNFSIRFSSHGARRHPRRNSLFDGIVEYNILDKPSDNSFIAIDSDGIWDNGRELLSQIITTNHPRPISAEFPAIGGMSAGKNTYTYDAHTYHTKVPPQGIAQLIERYLPKGGLVLDPFAGSGMTGVATQILGYDAVLNDLSPAAGFIANKYNEKFPAHMLESAIYTLNNYLKDIETLLYLTHCRNCGNDTIASYFVWSSTVLCSSCNQGFLLWDVCRKYGNSVREHKIMSEFKCPHCNTLVRKRELVRTGSEPVMVGYKHCGKLIREAPLSDMDRHHIRRIHMEELPIASYFPNTEIPAGVNLNQPKRHGLHRISDFYTHRNLTALSHLWKTIHQIDSYDARSMLAFVFTSLYKRVTKLSEYRFWGGSGNTANFNVPHLFNEANVFESYRRKGRSIVDHLETTASQYRGRTVVRIGAASKMNFLPSESVDLIFTDPPFGGNINYSEMNLLWEAWLDVYTNTELEAIVNRYQGKGVNEYSELMELSLNECYRVLAPGCWMLMVFMNSKENVWSALRRAISRSGFTIERVDQFDKQHGTFKQFVSANTTGSDLILHCRKRSEAREKVGRVSIYSSEDSIQLYFRRTFDQTPKTEYLHVSRSAEVDFRAMYSEWIGMRIVEDGEVVDFEKFQTIGRSILFGE